MFPGYIACLIVFVEITLAIIFAWFSYKDLKHEIDY